MEGCLVLKPILSQFLSDYRLINTIINTAYYFFILLGIFTALVLFYSRLVRIGYQKRKVAWFLFISGTAAFPLGYISSRAGGILRHPLRDWSLDLLCNQAISGTLHTFHASLFLPVLMFMGLAVLFRFSQWHVLDTGFLYIPLAHAIGRLGCLCAGCCWGDNLSFTLLHTHFSCKNPVPIYAALANLTIFIILRGVHERVYFPAVPAGPAGRRQRAFSAISRRIRKTLIRPFLLIRNKGGVFGGYLLLYGIARFLLEIIRTNEIVASGMTRPQLTMIVFVSFGILVLLLTQRRHGYAGAEKAHANLRAPVEENVVRETGIAVREKANRYLPLISYVIFLFAAMGAVLYLVGHGFVRWPFRGSPSLAKIYGGILTYLPVFLLACLSLGWLRWAKIAVIGQFGWRKFSHVFYLGLIISSLYSLYLLLKNPVNMTGAAMWPPIIALSVLNAFSEEILYRVVLYELLKKALKTSIVGNIVQGAVYALPHYFIGGMRFAAFAFLYGILLGLIKEKNQSIVPCILCHFLIDLGNIGAPLLLRPAIYF